MRLALILLPALLLAQTDADKLRAIFAEERAAFARDSPVRAWVAFGVRDGAGKWADESLEARTRQREQRHRRLTALRALNRETLQEQDRLNFDLLVYELDQAANLDRFPNELLHIGKREGPASLVEAFQRVPTERRRL